MSFVCSGSMPPYDPRLKTLENCNTAEALDAIREVLLAIYFWRWKIHQKDAQCSKLKDKLKEQCGE